MAHFVGAQGLRPLHPKPTPIIYFATTIMRVDFAAQIALQKRNCRLRECECCFERSTRLHFPTFVFSLERLSVNE
jgi:hypothetical protein